jgi:6,7-dimethyl-8-ribityllumazine synthase
MEFSGTLDGKGISIGIIISRFNEMISQKLLGGAQDCLLRHGVSEKNIDVYWVPGALEVPLIAKKAAQSGKYQAVITLGAVIQGDTPHFDIVAAESAKGVAMTALESGTPIINGIITTNTIEQAIERAGTKAGNKGYAAAESAIEMVNLIKIMSGKSK